MGLFLCWKSKARGNWQIEWIHPCFSNGCVYSFLWALTLWTALADKYAHELLCELVNILTNWSLFGQLIVFIQLDHHPTLPPPPPPIHFVRKIYSFWPCQWNHSCFICYWKHEIPERSVFYGFILSILNYFSIATGFQFGSAESAQGCSAGGYGWHPRSARRSNVRWWTSE